MSYFEEYLHRINFTKKELLVAPSYELLAEIHYKHVTSIPFEGLDTYNGTKIYFIDFEKLFNKLVRNKRGGFCFEQNTLLSWALRQAGFDVTPLSAQIAYPNNEWTDNTHYMLMVSFKGSEKKYYADVGFGAGPLEPISTEEGVVSVQYGKQYKVEKMVEQSEGEQPKEYRVLYSRMDGNPEEKWGALMRFTLNPTNDEFLQDRLHYVETNSKSKFLQGRLLTIATPDGGRKTLMSGLWLTPPHQQAYGLASVKEDGKEKVVTVLENEEQFQEQMQKLFGYQVPLLRTVK